MEPKNQQQLKQKENGNSEEISLDFTDINLEKFATAGGNAFNVCKLQDVPK